MSSSSSSYVLSAKENETSFHYNRTSHPAEARLCRELSRLYTPTEAKSHQIIQCLLTSSGMNAIHQVLTQVLLITARINVLYGSELYCDTPRLIRSLCPQGTGVRAIQMDVSDSKSILEVFESDSCKKQVNVLFLESCSNPSGHIFDFRLIPQLRKLSKRLILIVDNTWLSSAIFNPFEWGADIIVNSLTKYYSGSSCIAGAILINNQRLRNRFSEKLVRFNKLAGLHVSVPYCEMILQQLPSLEQRLSVSWMKTKRLFELASEKALQHIRHPFLPNHPSHDLAQLFWKKHPSLLSPPIFAFEMNCPKELALEKLDLMMEAENKIDFKTSYGSKTSRFCSFPRPLLSSPNSSLCRLYIGFEEQDDLIKERAFIESYNAMHQEEHDKTLES